MKIALCGSIKFFDKIVKTQKELEKLGHKVFIPVGVENVDYWAKDNTARVEVKKD